MYIVLLGNWFYLSAAESVGKYILLVVNIISLKDPHEYSLHLGHRSISNDTVDFNSLASAVIVQFHVSEDN